MNHDNLHEKTWKDKKDMWMEFVKNEVMCTATCYPSYSKGMGKFTGFGMKNSSTLPSLGWKYFNNLRDENDEPTYTFKDKYVRWFVRQPIEGDWRAALNQCYIFNIAEIVFEIICREKNVIRTTCEIKRD